MRAMSVCGRGYGVGCDDSNPPLIAEGRRKGLGQEISPIAVGAILVTLPIAD